MDALYAALRQKIQRISPEESGLTLALNQRQIACCEAVEECLKQTEEALSQPLIPLDVVTVPLTDALKKLDELMGRDTSEEVLTNVFQQFCVGK